MVPVVPAAACAAYAVAACAAYVLQLICEWYVAVE
jgi:hypothetical protein